MNTFSIIQNFFTRMTCRYCGIAFIADDVTLIEESDVFFVVRIHCHDCGQHNGDAAVGVETSDEPLDPDMLKAIEAFAEDLPMMPFGEQTLPIPLQKSGIIRDPDLTDEDAQRLEDYEPISNEDVLDAHSFIQKLDEDWMKFIPVEIRQRHTESDTES